MNRNWKLNACLLALAGLIFLVLILTSHSGGAELQESNIAIYMDGDEDNIEYVEAYEDGIVWFNLSLENYNGSDAEDRYVLLFIVEDAQVGTADRWDFQFANPIGGYNEPNFTSEADVDYYRYLVKGDGTPTKVEIVINHFYTGDGDNDDRIAFNVRGFDFEADTPEPYQGNWTRFFENMINEEWGEPNGSEPSNLTYLLEDRAYAPSVDGEDFEREMRLNARIIGPPPPSPSLWCVDSIVVVPGQTYTLDVNVVNQGYQNDQVKLTYDLDDPTKSNWQIEATNYIFGSAISLSSGEGVIIYVEITVNGSHEEVPAEEYDLVLTATSKDPRFKDEKTVRVTVPQRYDPLLEVVGEDDKIAKVDGKPTVIGLRLQNRGALNDTLLLFLEIGNMTSRSPGETHNYWTTNISLPGSMAYFPTTVTLEAGEVLDFSMGIKPALDHWKIPPGKYPVRAWAISQNNSARVSETGFIIRMPNLYDLEAELDNAPSTIRVGLEERYRFTLSNWGAVEDKVTLLAEIMHNGSSQSHSSDDPDGWSFSFEDAVTGEILANDSVLLENYTQQRTRQIWLRVGVPAGVEPGEYVIGLYAFSSGPYTPPVDIITAFGQDDSFLNILSPELFISPADITLSDPEPTEDDRIVITAEVHLKGAVDQLVNVEFYHLTDSQEQLIDTVALDLRGLAGGNVQESLTVNWTARLLPGANQSIEVRVDTAQVIQEEHEDNNIARIAISVQEKDDGGGLSPGSVVVAGFMLLLVGVMGALLFMLLLAPGKFEKDEKGQKTQEGDFKYRIREELGKSPGNQGAVAGASTKESFTAEGATGSQGETKPPQESKLSQKPGERLEALMKQLGEKKKQLESTLALPEFVGTKEKQNTELEAVSKSLKELTRLKESVELASGPAIALLKELESFEGEATVAKPSEGEKK